MADPGDLGKDAGDTAENASRDASRRRTRSARFGPEPRPSAQSAGRGNILDTLREMRRDAGGVGGGLANMTGGEGGCLRRLLPIILILAVILVVWVILSSIG